MNMRALTALVISLSLAASPLAYAQDANYVEVPAYASSITYNDAANCSDAQAIVTAAQGAANDRISDVNNVVSNVGRETRNRRACIENLMSLLTFAIPTFPSLTAIVTQLIQAFIRNLIGKACAAATGAINGAIGQVNSQIRGVQNTASGLTAPLQQYVTQSQSISSVAPAQTTAAAIDTVRQQIVNVPPVAAAPAAPQAQPTKSGWSSVSCAIFGGC